MRLKIIATKWTYVTTYRAHTKHMYGCPHRMNARNGSRRIHQFQLTASNLLEWGISYNNEPFSNWWPNYEQEKGINFFFFEFIEKYVSSHFLLFSRLGRHLDAFQREQCESHGNAEEKKPLLMRTSLKRHLNTFLFLEFVCVRLAQPMKIKSHFSCA